tara:strand:- start:483 stop:815 length:333 start_codon:yes stop_codon:yes gene_type:complete
MKTKIDPNTGIPFLTVRDVSEMSGHSKPSVLRHATLGKLPHVGRHKPNYAYQFRLLAVERWMRKYPRRIYTRPEKGGNGVALMIHPTKVADSPFMGKVINGMVNFLSPGM